MPARSFELQLRLPQWESDSTLLEPSQFTRRMAILDYLDRSCSESEFSEPDHASDLSTRALSLATNLESINNQFFHTIRRQIQSGICPREFAPILCDLATAPRGLAYDHLDDLLAGLFNFETLSEEPRPLGPDSVFYQPTPARHIFHLITAASITREDTLIDLGSGLGHVPLLTSICTGATSIGIELDPLWVAGAGKCATALNLNDVSFLVENAVEADLSSGTVFYLYTPFTGSTLASVLHSLRHQAELRPIRICTFGPCTIAVSAQSWLQPATPPITDQLTVFLSRA